MKWITTLILLLFSFGYFTACNNSENLKSRDRDSGSSNRSIDSLELDSLIVKLLKWHESDRQMDFETKKTNPGDSTYSGIDWAAHKKRMTELSNTNFFTDEFLNNYNSIAMHIDAELKNNPVKYYEGDIQPWSDDANDWCKCQDFPDSVWEKLRIVDLRVYGDSANFKWSWADKFYYSARANRENNHWKISYLERFDVQHFSW